MLPDELREFRAEVRERCDQLGEAVVREQLAVGAFGGGRKRHVVEEWVRERELHAVRAASDAQRATDLEIAREANEIARAANVLAERAERRAVSANRIAIIAIIAVVIALLSAITAVIPLLR